MTRRIACLGERAEDRRSKAEVARDVAQRLSHGLRSGRAVVLRDQFHEQVPLAGLATREQGSSVDGRVAARILDGERVALKQCGQRVGCGPRFLLDLQAIAHAVRRTGRRSAPHLDQPDSLRQHRAQSLRHGFGGEVLVERHGGPFAFGCDAQRQRIGEGHLETRVESLSAPEREAAAAQRPLEEAAEVEVTQEACVSVLGEAQGHHAAGRFGHHP